MFDRVIERILSGRVSGKLWLSALLANVIGLGSTAFLDERVLPEPSWFQIGGLVLLLLIAVVTIIYTAWEMIRRLGDARPHEQGSFAAWIGWSIVAIMPAALFVGVLETIWAAKASWWFSSLAFSVLQVLAVPLLIHADGRAINAEGPPLSRTMEFARKNYGRIFGAYILATLPSGLAIDGLDNLDVESTSLIIVLAILSALIGFVSSILCIAITVTAFREAEEGQ
jgi:CDP-diglyceride synthetase